MTIVLLLFIGVMAIDGFFVSRYSSSAMAFPKFVFAVAAVSGIAEIVRNIKAQKARQKEKSGESEEEPISGVFHDKKKFFVFTAMIFAYLILMLLTGFVVSSIVFCLAYGFREKFPNPVVLVITSVVIVLLWYFLFGSVLNVRLPAGMLAKIVQ